jgi:NhaP-type Na+/H+ or K+/H+ antiporter
MRRFLYTVFGAAAGYIAGAVLGYLLVNLLSPNQHDRELEAAMTGAFFSGPILAILIAIAGYMYSGKSTTEKTKV